MLHNLVKQLLYYYIFYRTPIFQKYFKTILSPINLPYICIIQYNIGFMKLIRILLIIILSLLYSNIISAQDLQILHDGTESLYFKITDVTNRTLEVTDRENSNIKYTGEIIIPEIVYVIVSKEAIPHKVTSIGKSAFSGCSGITSVTIPSSITSIGDYAFYGCSAITSVVVPNSVIKIGYSAFYGCYALKTIVNFSSLDLVKKSGSNGYIAYYSNKVVNAPNGELVDDFVFYTSDDENYLAGYIGNTTELVLPENYKGRNYGIGDQAFNSYTGLTSVTIPNNVTSIGDFSFWGCNNLTNITSFIPAGRLFAIREYTFSCVDLNNCTLYVPYKSKEKYTLTDGWKSFKNIVELRDTYKVTFCIDDKEVVSYDIKEGDAIIYPTEYEKEGYSLNWDINIDIMPSNDITIKGTFCVNTYSVTYIVDGEIYAVDSIAFGSEILLRDNPVKEGHTFSGWSEAPLIMPANDITISGSFSVNSYVVTYIVDGEAFATDSIAYGSEIVLRDEPIKEGHTFSGWSEAPVTMPAENITISGFFTVNSYTITYIVDGETLAIDSIVYGSEIVLRDEPTKEGHTFSGWSEAPETMPAEDITVLGSFAVNSYAVTYIVDGEEYKRESVVYGTVIILSDEPTKEGHTFSGWSEVPESMPAEDITITGTFSVNSYNVCFILDGDVYQTISVKYGEVIPLPEEPVKDGCTFSGWSEIPDAMPAEDITVTGTFYANFYTVTYVVDGDVYAMVTVGYNAIIPKMEDPVKEGHTFNGWENLPDVMPAQDITITGSFSVNAYNAIFIVDNTLYAKLSVNYGDVIELPEPPHKEGFVFEGWAGLPETMPAEDIVLIAIFIDVTGINEVLEDVKGEGGRVKTIYDLNGRAVDNPTNGIYIVNGKKVLVK